MRNIDAEVAEVIDQTNPRRMCHAMPYMRAHMDGIKEIREMYRALDLDRRQRKRSAPGLGRRVAHLPPATFLFLTHKAPEVLRNQNLLRIFLRNNPEYLVVDKI